MEWSKTIKIGDSLVGEGQRAYIIAEIGSNHNQDIRQAIELIDAAAEAGADAVKFQSLKLDQVHHSDHVSDEFQEFFKQIELSEEWYDQLLRHSRERNVDFISSPTYFRAVELLEKLPADAIKIASAQFGIHPFLVDHAAETGLPMIASTGLVSFPEVAKQVESIYQTGNRDFVLLHCVSRYPTPVEDVNLAMMDRYRDAFGCIVGFSDHTRSLTAPAIAVARGAAVIEKHITLDRNLPGPDHHFAVEPSEFRELVVRIREAESIIGSPDKASFTDEEEHFREAFIYRCIPEVDIAPGEAVKGVEKEARRVETGGIDVRLAPMLGREFVARKPLKAGMLIQWDDIEHVG